MKFKFIGEGDSDPKSIIAFGLEFVIGGDPVEVVEQAVINKLLGNSHFIEAQDEKVKHDAGKPAK